MTKRTHRCIQSYTKTKTKTKREVSIIYVEGDKNNGQRKKSWTMKKVMDNEKCHGQWKLSTLTVDTQWLCMTVIHSQWHSMTVYDSHTQSINDNREKGQKIKINVCQLSWQLIVIYSRNFMHDKDIQRHQTTSVDKLCSGIPFGEFASISVFLGYICKCHISTFQSQIE